MLYLLGLWLAEPAGGEQGRLLAGFAMAAAAAAFPCVALPVLVYRGRAEISRNDAHILLTPTAIACALLVIVALVKL